MKKRNRGDLWGQVSACNSDNKKRMVPFSIFLALKIVIYVCNDLKMWTEIPQNCARSQRFVLSLLVLSLYVLDWLFISEKARKIV